MKTLKSIRKSMYDFIQSKGIVLTPEEHGSVKHIMNTYRNYMEDIPAPKKVESEETRTSGWKPYPQS